MLKESLIDTYYEDEALTDEEVLAYAIREIHDYTFSRVGQKDYVPTQEDLFQVWRMTTRVWFAHHRVLGTTTTTPEGEDNMKQEGWDGL